MTDQELDELLEAIWTIEEEEKEVSPTNLKKTVHHLKDLNALILNAEREGLIEKEGSVIALTKKGRKRAENIIRRHRLAERLLADAFALPNKTVESTACEFEHILTPEVTDSICTFLGHPRTCPHGKPIPPGRCCKRFELTVKSIVLPLSELDPGGEGKVLFIGTKVPARLERLSVLGLVPGSLIRLRQKKPSVVVEIGETTIALDEGIAREIYVKRVKEEESEEKQT
ncbi:MAG: metal-dependent transcriptional regulator [Acidobacteria bacterium]|nr:metal-dependent transcriptional regulator [Acidobacteriota bacterium]